ncbi:MAG: FAD-dependent monooxygenase [Gammaproteobacteria bacterium]|nr:FAD-dependent monooxygenase [Gammaproteobacteria bacterium]
MTNTPLDYHIIIVGGGIAGLTLASLLAQSSLRIAIIDTGPLSHPLQLEHYDTRVSAINRASENIFRHLKIWKKIKQIRLSSYEKMIVTDTASQKKLEFDCADIGEPNLGHIIENQVMRALLEDYLHEHTERITLFPHFQISDVQIGPHQGQLENSNGKKLNFKLLIGADGKASWVRKKLGFSLTQKDYEHTALVATLKTQHPHNQIAYQYFLEAGPLAFLPLNDPHTCSLVWSSPPHQAQEHLALSKQAFETALTQAVHSDLGTVTLLSERHLFPLHYQHAQRYTQKRVALIGDAAHTLHPMAGLGLNLGLLDAACLAENLLAAHAQQRDLGLEKTLRRYERQQKTYNTLTLQTINFLKTFFCHTSPPTTLLKHLGLLAVNHASPIKNFLTRYALGLTGDLPNFAKLKSIQ